MHQLVMLFQQDMLCTYKLQIIQRMSRLDKVYTAKKGNHRPGRHIRIQRMSHHRTFCIIYQFYNVRNPYHKKGKKKRESVM